jgi:hypothetical protein
MQLEMIRMFRIAGTLAALCALAQPAVAAGAETASQTYSIAGEYAFMVPAGVTSLQVTLVGGNGGAGKGFSSGGSGGIPATVTAQLAVTPGEIMYAEVAGDGEAAVGAHNAGGYGGGGEGGARSGLGGTGGGGGGGASDLRTCSVSAPPAACSTLASRLIVAGGGGGGGGQGGHPESSAGGNGGPADQSGSEGHSDTLGDKGGSPGQRATLVAGGEFGTPDLECNLATGKGCATSGQLGSGGAGGSGVVAGGGGGGGGGIYGGGGGGGGGWSVGFEANGAGGGGGGGSSGVPAGAAGVSAFSLVPTASGAQPLVQISWTMPPPAASTGAPTSVTSTSATLTGSVNPDGSQVSDCHFVVVPAPPAGATIPCVQQVGAGSTPVAVSAGVGGLAPSTTYIVTLVASSAQGTGSGAGVPFTTASVGQGAGGSLIVTHVVVSPARFQRGHHAATISRAKSGPIGTTVSFQLSAAASVTLRFERAQLGVLVGRRCAPVGKGHTKGRHCTRYAAISHTVVRNGHAGLDRIHFEGLLDGGTRLAPGGYRLSLSARAASGSVTAAQHPTFTLLP